MSSLLTLVSPSGLLDLAFKSAAVMLLASVAVVPLRRASAAWRHLVWCLSVASLLLLPALSLALPAWRVTWLPQWAAERATLAATGQTALRQADRAESLAAQPAALPRRPTAIVVPPSAATPATEAQTSRQAAAIETTGSARGSFPWLAMVWAAGVLLSLVPLAVGLWQLAALRRRSRVIDDRRWLALLGELQRQLAVRRSVQLRQSAAALVPLTWGALKPVLLVPAEASAWPDERRRLVLLHELAHIRRWDWLTQLVAHVACAVHWFNPLVWLAARQMRIERERACDDLVLACGVRASDFAQELLALAAGLSDSRLSALVAVPMTRGGALEDRLRGILDGRRSRAAMTTAAVYLGAALAVAAAAPLAMLRAAPAQPSAGDLGDVSPVNKPAEAPSPPIEKSAEKPAEQPADKAITYRGKVVDDATGKPIEQFVGQAGMFDPADPKKVAWGYKKDPIRSRDGSFSTTIRWGDGWIETHPANVSKSYSTTIHLADRWTARILAAGYFPQPVLASAPPADKVEIEVATLRLKRVPDKIRGVVLNHAGEPVKEARVYAVGVTGLNLAGGQAWLLARDGVKDEGARFVRTDERGRFDLATDDAKSLAVSSAQLDAWPAAIPASGEITIRLPEPARVEIDLDIEGAEKESTIFYQLLTPYMPEFEGLQSSRYVNIANPGKLVLAGLPPAKYQLCRQSARMLDRQIFELKAGEVKTIDYVRKKGARVRGKVTWPADAKLSSIHVTVLDGQAQMVYSSVSPAADGTFLTERIPPGTQHLVAYAYKVLTPKEMVFSGLIPPSYQAQVTIEVPTEGELKVDDLALKPIRAEKPKDVGPQPAQPKQQPDKTDQERVVGNWFIMNDDSMRKGEMWVISEDRILMYAKHGGANGNLYFHRLDAGKNPKQIDINVTKTNREPIGVIKGIYALDGNEARLELRLCLGGLDKDRPAAFPKKPGPGEILILQRATSGASPPMANEERPAAKIDNVKIVTVLGKVVDDVTGEPIGRLVLQGGKFDLSDPKKVTWGYWQSSPNGRDGSGSFSTTVRWAEGWTARIVADGYIPQPVLSSAPPADKDAIEVTIRLKRGPIVRGVVLDHAGKPVKDAAVFAVRPTGLNLAAGQAWSQAFDGGKDDEARPVRTDEQGRFEVPAGGAKSVAVSHAQFDAWPAAIPASGEMTVHLPEPARVEIDLDIDGADKQSVIFYQLLANHMPEFEGLQSSRYVKIDNPGKLVLAALPPGRYQFCRRPGRILERQLFEIKPGETKTIDYVRKTGARVRGKATWPADAKLTSIVVSVVGETTHKSPFDKFEWNTVYASLSPGDDGTFLTERISPGTYQLLAYAFKPLTPEQMLRTGAIAPSFHAQVKIEVPAEGELAVKDLALQPIQAGK